MRDGTDAPGSRTSRLPPTKAARPEAEFRRQRQCLLLISRPGQACNDDYWSALPNTPTCMQVEKPTFLRLRPDGQATFCILTPTTSRNGAGACPAVGHECARLRNQRPQAQNVEHLQVAPRLPPVELLHILPEAAQQLHPRRTPCSLATLNKSWRDTEKVSAPSTALLPVSSSHPGRHTPACAAHAICKCTPHRPALCTAISSHGSSRQRTCTRGSAS